MVKNSRRCIDTIDIIDGPSKKKFKLDKVIIEQDTDLNNTTFEVETTQKIAGTARKKSKKVKKTTGKEEPIEKLKKEEQISKVDTDLGSSEKNGARQENKQEDTGINKNQCVCNPANDEEPTQSQLLEDHEAHMLVAEWRLHKFQSPIELRHEESISHDHFEPLEFHGHWEKAGEATFTNTGKTAVVQFQNREAPSLIGGPLHNDTYVFEQLHFHWSDDDKSGCEHIFEGVAFSMEAHAVHYNKKYSSFEKALDKHDGLAVIGFFLEATDNDDNPCFNKLTKAVQDIVKVGTATNVAADCLTWIKEEAQCKGYYTYQGSLTTEPYLESVTWILYPTPIHVSRQQVAFFRELKSTPCEQVNIVNNVRPIQTPPPHKKPNIFYARSHRKSE